MITNDIISKLKTLKIPLAHISFKKEVALPFIAYFDDKKQFGGDEHCRLLRETNLRIELYEEYFDAVLHAKINAMLNGEISETTSYISEEKMYMTIYEIDLFEKEK
ncbi:MAG: hypothetical protein RR458_04015 [Clostridia bacterium]